MSELPVLIKWLDFLKWLLAIVEKYPKKVRSTFTNRLINLALDNVEQLIEARYSKNKSYFLNRANLNLEKLRILLRISFEERYMSQKAYEQSIAQLQEVGKMLGGWIKSQRGEG